MKLTGPLERVLRAFLADPAAPRYGYDLMKASGLPSGTLYPMLARLQEQGAGQLGLGAARRRRQRAASPAVLLAHRRGHRDRPGRNWPGPTRPGRRARGAARGAAAGCGGARPAGAPDDAAVRWPSGWPGGSSAGLAGTCPPPARDGARSGNGRPSSRRSWPTPTCVPGCSDRPARCASRVGTIRTARREHGIFRGQLTGADARSAGVRLFARREPLAGCGVPGADRGRAADPARRTGSGSHRSSWPAPPSTCSPWPSSSSWSAGCASRTDLVGRQRPGRRPRSAAGPAIRAWPGSVGSVHVRPVSGVNVLTPGTGLTAGRFREAVTEPAGANRCGDWRQLSNEDEDH